MRVLLLTWIAIFTAASSIAIEGCRPRKATPDAGVGLASPSASPSSSPSPSADVTSHASTSDWGEAGAVATGSGTVDGNVLRARIRARIAADVSPVVVLQSHDRHPAFDLGKRLCEAVVPVKPPATPILLKPNLGGFEWFKDPVKSGGDDGLKGRTTDPEFVRGVVRCLRARGHDHVTLAEGWGATHADWEQLVRSSGYAKMAAEEHVPLVALDDGPDRVDFGATICSMVHFTSAEVTRLPL